MSPSWCHWSPKFNTESSDLENRDHLRDFSDTVHSAFFSPLQDELLAVLHSSEVPSNLWQAVSKPVLCPCEELIFVLHVSKAHLTSRKKVKVSKEQSCLAFQIFPIFAPLPTHISLSGLLLSRCEPSLLLLACASLPAEKWCITRTEQIRRISIPWGANEYRV